MQKVRRRLTLEDILPAIQYLSDQERKTLASQLRQCTCRKAKAKRALREAFGLWKDREDISDSIEYVNTLRSSWGRRLRRLGSDG